MTDSAGRRWFVTVAALAGGWRGTGPAAGYEDLRAAMDTVIALAGAPHPDNIHLVRVHYLDTMLYRA